LWRLQVASGKVIERHKSQRAMEGRTTIALNQSIKFYGKVAEENRHEQIFFQIKIGVPVLERFPINHSIDRAIFFR
jgi:hypothetical protein